MVVRSEERFKVTDAVFLPLGYLFLVMGILSVLVFFSWFFKSKIYTAYKWIGSTLTKLFNFGFLNYSYQEFLDSVRYSAV
jgi:hypothetical protein